MAGMTSNVDVIQASLTVQVVSEAGIFTVITSEEEITLRTS